MKRMFFAILLFFDISILIADEKIEFDFAKTKQQFEVLIVNEAAISLSITNCKPEKRITNLMMEIDKIGQNLLVQDQNDEVITLSEQCLAALTVLRERREYAYMLWAEGILEQASSGKYADLHSLDQTTLLRLYGILSDINISLIKENMLNREIMTRLSSIYDCLNRDNKQRARVRAIHQQRDSLSTLSINENSIPVRKSLDDF